MLLTLRFESTVRRWDPGSGGAVAKAVGVEGCVTAVLTVRGVEGRDGSPLAVQSCDFGTCVSFFHSSGTNFMLAFIVMLVPVTVANT